MLRWVSGDGEGGKRLRRRRGVQGWSWLGGGESDSTARWAACRRLLPAKFRRLRPELDGGKHGEGERKEGKRMVCFMVSGRGSLYSFTVQGGGHGRSTLGMGLQGERGMGEYGVGCSSSWRSS